MFFRKQKFFLDLTGQQGTDQEAKSGKGNEQQFTIAPPQPAPAAKKKDKEQPAATVTAPPTPKAAAVTPAKAVEAAPAPAPEPADVRTTAEEIAAQLAAEAASRPAPTLATFAPDCLAPGAATPRRRRTAGANLGAFKEIARGMMKS